MFFIYVFQELNLVKRCEPFRFSRAMKLALLNQVIQDNPDGMGCSSKGWDNIVTHLKSLGKEWSSLTVRCAREATKNSVKAWLTTDRANRKKYAYIYQQVNSAVQHLPFH